MQKTLFIVRGAPGAGKSALADLVAGIAVASADDYMIDKDGNYKFDPARLQECHNFCELRVLQLMEIGFQRIAVANTFVYRAHMAPYMRMAERAGYSVFVVECQNDFGNVHNVPAQTVLRMRSSMER